MKTIHKTYQAPKAIAVEGDFLMDFSVFPNTSYDEKRVQSRPITGIKPVEETTLESATQWPKDFDEMP